MPEFDAGSSKTARALMTNPTAKAFSYEGVVYMGTDLVEVSRVAFSLNANEQKIIGFPVVMPSSAGTYPVYIGVFSGGVLVALYKSTEDVTIVIPNRFEYAYCNGFRYGSVSGWGMDMVTFNWKVISTVYPVSNMRASFSVKSPSTGEWKSLFSGAWEETKLQSSKSVDLTFAASTAGIVSSGTYRYRVEMTALYWTGSSLIEIATIIFEGDIQYTR